jgi:hypothetical protein
MTKSDYKLWIAALLFLLLTWFWTGGTGWTQTAPSYQVFAFNDLGMHCYDADFSVLAVLPPYNVVRAQVVRKGASPSLLTSTGARLTYAGIADPAGSINTTSQGKTNFWVYVQKLFGVPLAVDVGLKGAAMPGAANVPQPFGVFDNTKHWFGVEGIPITAWDNAINRNTFAMMQVNALDQTTGAVLSSLPTVVPASDEMNCSNCHLTGGVAASAATATKYGITTPWSANPTLGIQTKENILVLHDGINSTTLNSNRPVLCASCHYSRAVDLNQVGPQGSQGGKPYLSRAMHSHHGKSINGTLPGPGNPPIVTGGAIDACYNCHPGTTTQCLRGAMATAGIGCQDCHGGLLAVGGVYNLASTGQPRDPWVDLPKCQSCHTGDVASYQGNTLILRRAYNTVDPAATPRIATNKRFAENDNTLYRFSLGHNGVACEACHGSTHAEWPVRAGLNDNITAQQIQGHTGPIIECSVCHGTGQALTTNGPHGLHNINNSNWNSNHDNFFENNPVNCQACHGGRLEGTPLSRVAADRSLHKPNSQVIQVAKGTAISCNLCHTSPPVTPIPSKNMPVAAIMQLLQ